MGVTWRGASMYPCEINVGSDQAGMSSLSLARRAATILRLLASRQQFLTKKRLVEFSSSDSAQKVLQKMSGTEQEIDGHAVQVVADHEENETTEAGATAGHEEQQTPSEHSRSRSNSGSSGSGDDEKKNGDVDEGDEDSADDHHSVENGDEVGERNGRNGKHVEANGNVS
ncbi:unnamed protein product [Anisakis simplex]|uniref:Prothymosin alpha-like n=1 Tax=Anisakis simplex TaxID=6269 RepID=A0A0M3K831_ANISI|nr:unnamed protein product [Anisakis simplex]